MTDKFINDKGEVAVLYCPGFGAGWSSWKYNKDSVYDPVLVQAVLDKKSNKELAALAKERFPEEYVGGIEYDGLEIEWIPQGEKFYIHEYDGSEYIVREDEFLVA